MAGKKDAPKNAAGDEWDDLLGEINAEKSAQKKRAAASAAADDILKAAKKAEGKAEETGAAEGGAAEPDAGAAAVARIEELELELATLKDQALRAMADAENVKRRSEKEVSAARVFGIERFANDILSVHDNLSRALQSLDGTDKSELGENAKNLVEGIELTEKDLMAVLARHGVTAVAGVGEKFDPNVHQAVANIPSEEDKGNVATVMQSGFKIGDRTLRAAMVAVSTGKA
jgi:molecular chaperone GrpE